MKRLARSVAPRGLESERVVAALSRAFAALSAPRSPWRATLAREHGVYSAQAIEHGVAAGVLEWDERCMRGLLERELPERFAPPGLTVVWLAGSIPTAAFAALALPLLAGSPVHAKPASADPRSPGLFARLLAELDPEVGAAIRVSDGRDRAADLEVLRGADAVVAHGSDQTLSELARVISPHQRFAPHGHKLSVAVVGPDAPLAQAAAACALDAALWDGRGCLSPAWIFVIDRPPGRAAAFADALFGELGRLARELPRGRLEAGEEIALREWRARGTLRGDARSWLSEPGSDFGVLLDADAPEPGVLRNVALVPIETLDRLDERCRRLRPHLSTLAHLGLGPERAALERIALGAGASRLCALGRMQLPPLGWNHDGMGALRPLLRSLDVECAP